MESLIQEKIEHLKMMEALMQRLNEQFRSEGKNHGSVYFEGRRESYIESIQILEYLLCEATASK